MSGFAVHLDFARAVPPDLFASVAAKIADRGPHRRATREVGPCSLAHAALWTTHEAEQEEQPQRHVTRDIWVAADARIDNRAELVATLRGSVEQPLHTDADLLLGAYEWWGADLVDHVVGDFAFAMWDADIEELLVARDPVGIRPLFSAHTPTGFVAASTLPAVLAALGDRPAIDEEYVAGFLHGLPPRDRTVWSGIERLAPGHRIRLGRDHGVADRYWVPALDPLDLPIEQTTALVQEAFDEAVRCRLRTRDGVACDLSGGLDSTTITATAVGLRPEVRAVSLVYRVDLEAFELDHIEAVGTHLGLEPTLVEADDLETLDPMEDIRAHCEPLFSADATDTAGLYDAVASLGCSVSLTGVGGDEVLDSSWTAPGRVQGSVRRRLLRWSGRHPDGLVASAIRSRRRRRVRRERPWLLVPCPDGPGRAWYDPSAAAKRLTGIEAPWNPPAFELTDRLAAERNVEVRYPFLDRRLVELLLRLPEDHIRTSGDGRGLHRRAFGARLPESVAERTAKADLTASFRRRMDAVSGADASMALAELGDRLDPAAVRGSGSGTWPRWAALSAGMFVTVWRGTVAEPLIASVDSHIPALEDE